MAKYIMALDAGTTSNRAILFDKKAGIVSVSQAEFPQYFPEPGLVEHDAEEIWASMRRVAVQAMEKVHAGYEDIAAIGITNQRETAIVWEKETGKPVGNAIVWQDRRTADFCDQLIADNETAFFQDRTGLIIDPYFSATKIRWILDHYEGARERAEKG
ncbi:MAG: glycerol kinase, partial [Lachnospiraceae bacterium]|nr:glycerol kinase [Lachnospiraceae bacterium]